MNYWNFTQSVPSLTKPSQIGDSWEAVYNHPKGFAKISSDTYSNGRKVSNIQFIHEGVWHMWTFERWFTPIGLGRKAFQLINDVTKN